MTPPVSVCHPRVDNRAPPFSYNTVIPLPGLWINRFADRTNDAQRASVVTGHQVVTQALQCTDSCRGGEERVDSMFVNDLPKPIALGVGRYAFEHEGFGTNREGAINDIGVGLLPSRHRQYTNRFHPLGSRIRSSSTRPACNK